MKLKEIMSEVPFFLHPDRSIRLAAEVMEWQFIRHVPVVDADRKVVGIVTYRDLLRAFLEKGSDAACLISDVMRKFVLTAGPDMEIESAAREMLENRIGCLPIVDSAGGLVGIVTEADFVRTIAEGRIAPRD